MICDAARVIAERAAFWWPLAEDQDRRMTVEVAPGPVPVFVAADDLATCADILLGNVFAHTPEGVAFAVRLAAAPRGARGWSSPTTGPGSVMPTPPAGASRAAAPPVSAWTSPAASPKRPAGR